MNAPTQTAKPIVTKRAAVGSSVGALIGWFFGGPIGAAGGALVGGAVSSFGAEEASGVITPKRRLIFARAMESIQDPIELRKLADVFESQKLMTEARLLRKRAALRELPPETREKRKNAFRRAMASDVPDVINRVAAAFEQEGAIDAAKTLRSHAAAVQAAHTAGRVGNPTAANTQKAFADKLGKSIIHFGPNAVETSAAAQSLIRSRGKQPTAALVKEVIALASERLQLNAPKAAPPAAPIEIDADTVKNGIDGQQAPAAPPAAAAPVEPMADGSPAPPVEPERSAADSAEETQVMPAPPPASSSES